MARRPWTTGELARLREMRARGMSVPRCAAALDRTEGSVSAALHRMGLTTAPLLPKRRCGSLGRTVAALRAKGFGVSHIADVLGVHRSTVYGAMNC